MNPCTIVVTLGGGVSQMMVIDAGQSCVGPLGMDPIFYSWDLARGTGSFVVTCRLRFTLRGPIIGSVTGTFAGNYTVKPDTPRNRRDTIPSATGLS
jgi:hypothetical protein